MLSPEQSDACFFTQDISLIIFEVLIIGINTILIRFYQHTRYDCSCEKWIITERHKTNEEWQSEKVLKDGWRPIRTRARLLQYFGSFSLKSFVETIRLECKPGDQQNGQMIHKPSLISFLFTYICAKKRPSLPKISWVLLHGLQTREMFQMLQYNLCLWLDPTNSCLLLKIEVIKYSSDNKGILEPGWFFSHPDKS